KSLSMRAFVMQSLQYVFPQHGVFIGSMNILLSAGHSRPLSRSSFSSAASPLAAAADDFALAWYFSHDALSGLAMTKSPSAFTMMPGGRFDSSSSPDCARATLLSTVVRNDRGIPVVRFTRRRLSYSGSSFVGHI